MLHRSSGVDTQNGYHTTIHCNAACKQSVRIYQQRKHSTCMWYSLKMLVQLLPRLQTSCHALVQP